MNIDLRFDGAVRVSKLGTEMGWGVAVFVEGRYEDEFCVTGGSLGFPTSSVNIAEWEGCIAAMKLAYDLFGPERDPEDIITVYGDSEVIVKQFNQEYTMKEKFYEYYNRAKEYADKMGIKKIIWQERKFNKHADVLSKIGLQQILINISV